MEINTKVMYLFVHQVAIGLMRIMTGDTSAKKRGIK